MDSRTYLPVGDCPAAVANIFIGIYVRGSRTRWVPFSSPRRMAAMTNIDGGYGVEPNDSCKDLPWKITNGVPLRIHPNTKLWFKHEHIAHDVARELNRAFEKGRVSKAYEIQEVLKP